MSDNPIYDTLSSYLSDSTLQLPANAFGATGGLFDTIVAYFGAELDVDGVTLVPNGTTSVSFSGATVTSAPLAGMTADAMFSDVGGAVQLDLTATPPANWTFGTGWPLLQGNVLDSLGVGAATFGLASYAHGATSKGLTFTGSLELGAAWDVVSWLLGGTTSPAVSGLVGQTGTVPTFDFAVALGTIDVPLLGTLALALEVTCAAVDGSVQPPGSGSGRGTSRRARLLPSGGAGGPIVSAWVPQTSLGLSATIPFADTTIGIFVDLSTPDGPIAIVADVSQLGLVRLETFAQLVPGLDLASALPPPSTFDPGELLQVQSLTLTLDAAQRSMTSVGIVLQSTHDWGITNGISAGPIVLQFTVVIAGKNVFASLTGLVDFTGGSFQLGAYYPGWIFTGGLTAGSTIDVAALLDKVLPTPVHAALVLDELDFVVQATDGGAFSLATGLTGDWSIPVGIATIDLTGASMELARDSSGTTGAIAVQGNVAGSGISFDGSWTLPGTFALSAAFPPIDLSSLAATLSGTTPPSGLPAVGLAAGMVAIVLDVASGDYTFALAADATVSGNDVGGGVFVVRRTATAFGFLVGFVVPGTWSPADLWSDLGPIFEKLTFTNSGLVVSTLPPGPPNLPNIGRRASLPATVSPGFTFFSTLALSGDILGPLSNLFDSTVTFDLNAVVDTANPVNSDIKAIFNASAGSNAIEFKSVIVDLKPGAETFTISANAVLTIQGDAITLVGIGAIALSPTPAASFSILIENWVEPFGIPNLTVVAFGLQVKVEETGLTIGLLGAFEIGSGARSFTLVVFGELTDFEEPTAIGFMLDADDQNNPLMLTDVIEQFTTLDLSSVPVLNAVGFTKLEFYVVDDPNGFTIGDYTFPPGIGLHADIFVYTWEAKFDLQVVYDKGIIASGSINDPISLFGVFALSDVSGTKGPSGSIDTTALPSRKARAEARRASRNRRTASSTALAVADKPYFTLDGRVQFLGIAESVKAQASKTSFDFQVSFAFLEVVTATLDCSLIDAKNFSAAATFGFDLNVTLGPLVIDGVTLIPQVTIDGPQAEFDLSIAVNPTVIAELSCRLTFAWRGWSFDVSFTLNAGDIANELTHLWSAMIGWLQDHVEDVFSEILGDVAKWVDAVKNVFTELGDDIDEVANALANYFVTAAEDAAQYLKDLGFDFDAIVQALYDYFKIAWADAVAIAEALFDDICPVETAYQSADGVNAIARRTPLTIRDLRFALTTRRRGRELLAFYYGYRAELSRLLARHPAQRGRLERLERSARGADDLYLLCDTAARALFTIAPEADPQLRTQIDALIPLLMDARTLSHGELLRSLE